MGDNSPDIPSVAALPDVQTDSQIKPAKVYHAAVEGVGEASTSTVGSSSTSKAEIGSDDAIAVELPELEGIKEEFWDLKMLWCGKLYDMRVGASDMCVDKRVGFYPARADECRVYDFRAQIQSLTEVPPVRQKLIGLTKGKLSAELDSTRFGTLGVKNPCKFTMIGTPEDMSFKDPDSVNMPEVRRCLRSDPFCAC